MPFWKIEREICWKINVKLFNDDSWSEEYLYVAVDDCFSFRVNVYTVEECEWP